MKAHENPAYHIPLTGAELALLGEIVVIIGQIDDAMALSLTGVLGVDRPTANAIMRTQDAIDIWSGCLKNRCDHVEFPRALELAAQELKAVMKARNDFVHADYRESFLWNGNWIVARGPEPYELDVPKKTVASRTRDQRKRPASELNEIRAKAARTSRLVAQVTEAVAPHGGWENSPWYGSLKGLLAS